MSKKKKKFTGVFTPKEVFNIPISWFQRYVLSSIMYLDNETGCTASNQAIAKKLNCPDSQVSRAIKYLKKLDLIIVETEGPKNNQRRKIQINKTAFSEMTNTHLVNNKTAFSKCVNDISQNDKTANNIKVLNSKVNKKINSECSQEEKEQELPINEEKNNIKEPGRNFGGNIPVRLRLYQSMKERKPDAFPDSPFQQHMDDLKRCEPVLKQFIREEKKKAGNPYFNASDNEIVETWCILLDNLRQEIKDKYFNTKSLANNLHNYLYEIKNGTHGKKAGKKQRFTDTAEWRQFEQKLKDNNI